MMKWNEIILIVIMEYYVFIGMFAPSGGTATVNGFDITVELDKVRDNLGLCPQHNMLFDKLTVSEHLRFFGQVRFQVTITSMK